MGRANRIRHVPAPHHRRGTAPRLLAGVTLGYLALFWLGTRAGSTATERRTRLAGDELIPRPHLVTDHAVTIDAPPEAVWPWLTQMGWHRAGWYTPDWVDRVLFPANWPSARQLDLALVRRLVAGDVIPDGPPGTAFFVVEHVDPPRELVLHSTTHLPQEWQQRFGASVDWTWAFYLTPTEQGHTRVHLRVRGRLAPWWMVAAYLGAIVPADLVMATGMLRGLAGRAGRSTLPQDPGAGERSCPGPGWITEEG